MKRFVLFLFGIFICTVAFADTINIDWLVDGNTYAQTNCEIGGGVTLPTEPTKYGYDFIGWSEIFNRGTFANWASIPNSAGGYLGDSNGSNIPQENDYIIVNDASDVPEYGEDIEIYLEKHTPYEWRYCRTYIDGVDYGCEGSLLNGKLFVYGEQTSDRWYNRLTTHWRSDTQDVIFHGSIYTIGNEFFEQIISADNYTIRGIRLINGYPYSGKWLLRYHGNWSDYGRGGWVAEKSLD